MRSLKSLLTVLVATVLVSCGGGGGCASSAECTAAAATAASGSAVPSFSAIAVSIGFDGTIASVDADKRYGKTFVVAVADPNGFAVAGAVVTPEVSIPSYRKGFFTRTDDFSVTGYTFFDCPNEDINRNDVLDPLEDRNGDGEISPRQSLVTVTPTSAVTDANGVAFFEVRHFKSHAAWMTYRFTANVVVNTTEGSASQLNTTGFIAGDEAVVSTPFINSPWGRDASAAGCTNRL